MSLAPPIYAGSEAVVVSYATKPSITNRAGRRLVPADVTHVKVSIYDEVGVELLANQAMTYDSDLLGWVYGWDSGANEAGIYWAMAVFTGLDGKTSARWHQFSLDADPV